MSYKEKKGGGSDLSDAEIDQNYEQYKAQHGIQAAPPGVAVVHRTEYLGGISSGEGCRDNTGAVVPCPEHDAEGSDDPPGYGDPSGYEQPRGY
jgi:hypothetical protein